MTFEPIIGLEIHIQLATKTKMYCSCLADVWKVEPNTRICPVCLGLPGALPVVNEKAIEYGIKTALALNCAVNEGHYFERKNYFYPDLPKGYQISQLRQPLSATGFLEILSADSIHRIRINRVHLEEDTAKSIHYADKTLIDFNKSGMPLLEIVSEPDINSAKEAVLYARSVQDIVRRLEVSEGSMEKGHMRLEANISLRPVGETALPNYRVEIKNINSFRFLETAINYEIDRQGKVLNAGEKLIQETRGYNESEGKTYSQRSKEEAHDYRYFPEPDIPPFKNETSYISSLANSLPNSTNELVNQLILDYSLSDIEANLLAAYKDRCEYFKLLVKNGVESAYSAKLVINRPQVLNQPIDKTLMMIFEEKSGLISDEKDLVEIIKKVIEDNSKAVEDYQSGKEASLQFLIGQVMRATQGKANHTTLETFLKKTLKK